MKIFHVSILFAVISVMASGAVAEVISGQVLDYYGTSPVNNVSVQCIETTGSDSTTYRFTTGTDGAFSVSVPPATYYVCVNGNESDSLYYPQYYGGWNYAGYSATVTVTDGVDVPDIMFYMYAGFKVYGTVMHQGNPVEASIVAYDNTTGYLYSGVTGTTSGTDGVFTMTLPRGTYEFFAYSSDHIQGALLAPVVINDDRDTTNPVNLVFTSEAAVSGTISGPGGELIESVRVDAFDMESMYSYSYGTTDENGDYTIPGLKVGRTYLFLCRTNFNASYTYWDLPGTWYPATTDVHTATPVTIAAAGHTGIDIALEANGGTLSGIVTNEMGDPIENAYVYDFYYPDSLINPFSAIAQRTLYTSESGAFTLTGIAGNVGLAVVADGYIAQIYNGHNITTLLNTGESFTMSQGSEYTDIIFELKSTDDIGTAPTVSSVSPHLVVKGSSAQVTITGASINPAAQIDLIDYYPFHYDGSFPTYTVNSITGEQIDLTISAPSGTATGAYYLAITNPDGQYFLAGFAVIDPEPGPTFKIQATPEIMNANSTMTLLTSSSNLTLQPKAVDGYAGLVLPTGDAIFYDGTNFSMDLIKYYDNTTLTPGTFGETILEFELPLGGAVLPAGDYLWFAGLFDPGTWELVDISLKTIRW